MTANNKGAITMKKAMTITMNFKDLTLFQEEIQQGIPSVLPQAKAYPADANRAPKRKDISIG